MYVDPLSSLSSMKTDQDVNEATAALKGMLGLGVSRPTSERTGDSTEARADTNPSPPKTPSSSNKKKRNNNKKKKVVEVLQKDNQKTTKDTTVSDNPTSRKKRNSKKKVQKEPETFALSAFQSSPDASKLPIPEFVSDLNETKSNISPEVSTEESTEKLAEGYVQVTTGNTFVDEKDAPASYEQNSEADSCNDAPVSTTGVNLAALAAKPPHSDYETVPAPSATIPAQNLPQQPIHLTQHNSPRYGVPPSSHLNPSMMPFPHQYPNFSSPIPMQFQRPHLHHIPYPPPPPPGYMLVQVQVPPVLLPGRQMVVTTPSGYPIQVVVPEIVPAGAWMPVHVPLNPPHMHPHPMMQQTPLSHNQYDAVDSSNCFSIPGGP